MTVKEQKSIKFVNDCDCIVDYNLLEKAMLWYAKKPMQSVKHIYLHANYPTVSISKEKLHVHRLLMMYLKEGKLSKADHVHHLDKNQLNSLITNLKVVNAGEHISGHLKGVKKSKEFKRKISEANKHRKGIKMKKRIDIPKDELKLYLKEGLSVDTISKIYGCDWTTIKVRINDYDLNDLRKIHGKKYLKYGRKNPELLEVEE